jgi:hypothetical protein
VVLHKQISAAMDKETDMADLETAYAQGPTHLPPICLRTHWDPTAVSRQILPPVASMGAQSASMVFDPRPATMICHQYYTTSAGDAGAAAAQYAAAPMDVPAALRGGLQRPEAATPQVAFPPGGAAGRGFPYAGYNPAAESDLFRVQEHLTKCAEKRYLPPQGAPAPDMGVREIQGADQNPNIRANIVTTSTHCRAEDDQAAWERSSRLFFNPTRYDRTAMVPATGLRQAESKMALRC